MSPPKGPHRLLWCLNWSSYPTGTWSNFVGSTAFKLTIHFHPVSKLRTGGRIPPPPPYVVLNCAQGLVYPFPFTPPPLWDSSFIADNNYCSVLIYAIYLLFISDCHDTENTSLGMSMGRIRFPKSTARSKVVTFLHNNWLLHAERCIQNTSAS